MTSKNTSTGTIPTELDAQRAYIQRNLAEGFDFDLMVADAFVRGIRDLGYRSTATALDELIDNSNQAGATKVAVAFAYGSSDAKPTHIAVIDNGHGMDPDMIRLAVRWGGTHRENDRAGFGRYGYGLPSASVGQGRRFTVYSATADGKLFSVTLDVDDISDGKYNRDGRAMVPEVKPAKLPQWVQEKIEEQFGGLTHGTIVVIEKLDRLTWKTATALERNLLEHFGLTYRNFLRELTIVVNGTRVEPVDPLFLTPGCRYYDLDDERAVAYDPGAFDVKDANTGKPLGTVKVRFAYMPLKFLSREGKIGSKNARFNVRDANNGIIVLRQGRQIDVITRTPFTTIRNTDRYWCVEVDFPATLDEEFHVTTSKQQIVLSERMWELLKQNGGVNNSIQTMRRRYEREAAELRARLAAAKEEKRASEQAMEEAAKFKTKKPGRDMEQRRRKAGEALGREVQRRAEQSGVAVEEVERELVAEIEGRPYKVAEETLPGAPFFRVEQCGGQRVIYLNTAHRFYTDVYASPYSTPYMRSALEVLLFVIGECELDSNEERQLFYGAERAEWSNRLQVAIDLLKVAVGAEDAEAEADEWTQAEAEVAKNEEPVKSPA